MDAETVLVGVRLRDYVADELDAATAGLRVQGRRELRKGIHATRKAIRRARAALRLGWREPDAGVAMGLAELKRLNVALSDLRDAHVLVGVVDRLLMLTVEDEDVDAGDRAALQRARKTLKARRKQCERDPHTQETIDAVAAALAFVHGGIDALPWDAVDASAIEAGLDATRADIARSREHALPKGSAPRWHKWRRRLRRLSQQRRACEAIGLDGREDAFTKSLTEQLGVLQDLNVLMQRGPREARSAAKQARNAQRKRLASIATSGEGG